MTRPVVSTFVMEYRMSEKILVDRYSHFRYENVVDLHVGTAVSVQSWYSSHLFVLEIELDLVRHGWQALSELGIRSFVRVEV